AIRLITIIMAMPLLFFTGCKRNYTNESQNNLKQGENTVKGDKAKAINTYTVLTKNTSRILGNNAEGISLATACMIWPATEIGNRPKAVLIAPSESWQIQLAAVDLIHHPSDGPLLVSSKENISEAVFSELSRLNPIGSTDGIKIITIGMSENAGKQLRDKGYKIHELKGDNPNKLAEDIDNYYSSISGDLPNSVIIGSSEQLEYTLPAGNWIAHMPEPLLYVSKDTIPPETENALKKRKGNANIYLLGPASVVSKNIETKLQKYGKVTRISGDTPYANSIAFSKFKDHATGFGWGITMPGHGLLLVSKSHAKESIASVAFSHRGKHAPLLITDTDKAPQELLDYLKELKPHFKNEPTEGPYTHLFIAGDNPWISQEQQGNLDNLIEIEPENGQGETSPNKMNH
ncbi:cell wall-binding repeat-containing protein, partial [Clostridium lacusfryxellense]|uniref:cell wall-binding repeat-containing protein n=1 Tax=Clostridium lacusfryxellense TaxID=205328 RepID=UPI001C0D5B42